MIDSGRSTILIRFTYSQIPYSRRKREPTQSFELFTLLRLSTGARASRKEKKLTEVSEYQHCYSMYHTRTKPISKYAMVLYHTDFKSG